MNKMLLFAGLTAFVLLAGCMKEDHLPIPKDEVETVSIRSAIVQEDYVLYVYTPPNYNQLDSLPLLVQLDGNTTTGSVIESTKELRKDGLIRDYLIVCIDYAHSDERVRDFTPTAHETFAGSGGAANYYRFLTEELLPMLQSRYRIDLEFGSSLRGHSLGGLFASYALFQPDSAGMGFDHYIIESPSWWWDNDYIFGLEAAYFELHSALPKHVYCAVGELEGAVMKVTFESMEAQLNKRQYTGLQSTFEMLKKQDHLEVRENDRGLKTIFDR